MHDSRVAHLILVRVVLPEAERVAEGDHEIDPDAVCAEVARPSDETLWHVHRLEVSPRLPAPAHVHVGVVTHMAEGGAPKPVLRGKGVVGIRPSQVRP